MSAENNKAVVHHMLELLDQGEVDAAAEVTPACTKPGSASRCYALPSPTCARLSTTRSWKVNG